VYRLSFFVVVSALAACSASTPRTFDGDGGGPTLVGEDAGFGTTPGECSQANQQVYVVTRDSDLYQFAPQSLAFAKVGNINCTNAGAATPFSMAVDRKGIAWVLFNDGKIWHVNTRDARCTSTSYVADQGGFHTFGMAFVSDTSGGTAETLYVADYNAKGLAKIDTTTLKLTFIAPYDAFSAAGELTGRGDARMFAFFNKKPPVDYVRVSEVDKTAKIVATRNLTNLDVGAGWAFAHWGGDFWLFTAPNGSSQVTKYSFADDTSTTVKQGLGFVIVGAGVSTCAPVTPPR
jgi:hypothetical protein